MSGAWLAHPAGAAAAATCPAPLQVRDKLANLVNVRRHKMEEGLHQIGSTATVRVNGLGAYELNLIRSNFQGALNMFLKLETVGVAFFGARAGGGVSGATAVSSTVAAAAGRCVMHKGGRVRAEPSSRLCGLGRDGGAEAQLLTDVLRLVCLLHSQAEAAVAVPPPMSSTYGSTSFA